MIRGLYTAGLGMVKETKRMDVISNNLANVNTTAFKADGVVSGNFSDVLQNVTVGGTPMDSRDYVPDVDKVFTKYEQGSMVNTSNDTDFGIINDDTAFFEIVDPDGNTFYTRDGSFKISADGYLVTSDGYTVMGENGSINVGQEDFTVSEIGEIIDKNGDTIDRFSIKSFAQKERIEKVGNNMVKVPDDIEAKDFEGGVKQGFLESSNVNSVEEMVDMIAVMRSYEANQKILQAHDELLGKSVNQLGSLS